MLPFADIIANTLRECFPSWKLEARSSKLENDHPVSFYASHLFRIRSGVVYLQQGVEKQASGRQPRRVTIWKAKPIG
jgi:hypothetical protein